MHPHMWNGQHDYKWRTMVERFREQCRTTVLFSERLLEIRSCVANRLLTRAALPAKLLKRQPLTPDLHQKVCPRTASSLRVRAHGCTMMSLGVTRSVLAARPVGARQCVAARAKAGNWLPGADSPAHLDGSLPGDYGFDPLGLVRPTSPTQSDAAVQAQRQVDEYSRKCVNGTLTQRRRFGRGGA
jgi:Chlorophyll A-B binding protein